MKTRRMSALQRSTMVFAALLIMVAFSPAIMAQELSFGPKIGISSTTLVGNDVPDGAKAAGNFVGGFFFKANAGDIVAIQPEVLYHRKGSTTKDSQSDDGQTLTIDYLEVPLLIKVQIPVEGTVYPFVYAGPYGAFELDNTYEARASFFGIQWTATDQADVNDFDYGAVVGAGLDIQADAIYFGLDARYGIGMSQILMVNDEQKDVKNRSLSLMVSLGVNL